MAGTTETVGYVGITGGWRTPTDGSAQIRHVNEQFEAVDPDSIAYVRRAGGWDQFTVDENYKVEWVEDDIFKPTIPLSSTAMGTTGDPTFENNDSYRLTIGDVLQIDDEKMLITALPASTATGNTATVRRGAFGTTAATHAASSTIHILMPARAEGSDSPFAGRPNRTFLYNYFQFVDQGWQMSEQYSNLREYGDKGRKKLAQDRARATKKLAVAAEKQLLLGTRYIGVDPEPSTVGGLFEYITSAYGAYRTSLSGDKMVEANLHTGIRYLADQVGVENIARTFVGRFYQKQRFTSFFEGRVRTELGTHTGGLRIDNIDTDLGNFEFVMLYNWPGDRLGLIDFDKIEIGHWAGMGWSEKRLAESGRYLKYTRSAVISQIVHNPQVHGLWTNLGYDGVA